MPVAISNSRFLCEVGVSPNAHHHVRNIPASTRPPVLHCSQHLFDVQSRFLMPDLISLFALFQDDTILCWPDWPANA
jgi:hypothetical protein